MKVRELIEMLQEFERPDAVVRVYDPETNDFEEVSGAVLSPTRKGVIDLYSDEP